MPMVILNPTDEEITVQWGGNTHVFSPNARRRVEDSMGRQVIHNYGTRGLVALEYGDEGEKELEKIKEGRARNDEFWTKQCVNYNQINEQRQQRHQSFVKPTLEVVLAAKRLGIKLLEPYKLTDESTKQISLLMEQNKNLEKELEKKDSAVNSLQSQVSELTENFKKLMSLASDKSKEEKAKGGNGEDKEIDYSSVKTTVAKMNKKRYATWLAKNWTEIKTYPDDVKRELAAKHETLYGIPFPDKRPAVGEYDVALG